MSSLTTELIESLSFSIFTVICLLIITVLVLYKYQNQAIVSLSGSPLPPGPWGLPLVGYLPWIPRKKPHLHFTELQKKYGPLISFYIGNRLALVLGNYEIIRDAYVTQGDIFAGRPRHSAMEIDGDEKGISVSDGPLWREQRHFVLKTLKEYGVGTQSIEPAMKEEIFCFLQDLRNLKGKLTDLRPKIGPSISNNICILEFGKRFEYSDDNFLRVKKMVDNLTNTLDLIPLQLYFPWIRKVPGTNLFMNYGKLQRGKREIFKFVREILKNHEANFETDEHKDLIFAWLDEELERLNRDPQEDIFTRENLLFNLFSLFIAGSQTVTSTLLSSVYYLAKFPQIQDKCRKEIYDVIGNDRLPSLSDKSFLPYIEATILEIHRHITVNPLSLVHRTMEDTELCGYYIPKDTVVYSNQYAVHYDKKTWGDPHVFRPERFLNDQNQVVNQDKIIPFSIGKRSCLGISLAKTEVFLYFTSLVQNFEFKPPLNEKFQVEFEGSILLTPAPFKIRTISLETPILKGTN